MADGVGLFWWMIHVNNATVSCTATWVTWNSSRHQPPYATTSWARGDTSTGPGICTGAPSGGPFGSQLLVKRTLEHGGSPWWSQFARSSVSQSVLFSSTGMLHSLIFDLSWITGILALCCNVAHGLLERIDQVFQWTVPVIFSDIILSYFVWTLPTSIVWNKHMGQSRWMTKGFSFYL